MVVSDKGRQFVSEVFKDLCLRLNIDHIKTVPYRSLKILNERVNRNLMQIIAF